MHIRTDTTANLNMCCLTAGEREDPSDCQHVLRTRHKAMTIKFGFALGSIAVAPRNLVVEHSQGFSLSVSQLTSHTSGKCCRYLAKLFVEGLCGESKEYVVKMQTVWSPPGEVAEKEKLQKLQYSTQRLRAQQAPLQDNIAGMVEAATELLQLSSSASGPAEKMFNKILSVTSDVEAAFTAALSVLDDSLALATC